jgi:hypothetical protein
MLLEFGGKRVGNLDAASATFWSSTSALSTSIVPMRRPATLMTSSTRPSSQKLPLSSRLAPSPVE